jgi:hypothetical protein
VKLNRGDACCHHYGQQGSERQSFRRIQSVVVKANEDLPQNKGNADFSEYPQAYAMELQVVRKGAKQFNENKDRENIDHQLPIYGIYETVRKAVAGYAAAGLVIGPDLQCTPSPDRRHRSTDMNHLALLPAATPEYSS